MNKREESLNDLISQTEAAKLRGVSRAAIHALVLRGRLLPVSIGGKTFVRCSEVLSFERGKPGPDKKATKKGARK